MMRWMLLLLVLGLADVSHAATYYVSPSGSGGTCSSGSPCTLSTVRGLVSAGDTVILNNGTYTGSSQMMGWSGSLSGGTCTATVGGSSSQPITFRAANDGLAIIDGQYAREPMRSVCMQYVTVEGIRFQNSSKTVVSLAYSSNNIFRRISAYNGNYYPAPDTSACPGVTYYNYHVMEITDTSNYVLVEDSIFSGTGRNLFNFFGVNHGIFQRNILIGGGYARGSTIPGGCTSYGSNHGEPMQVYGSSDITVANVLAYGLGTWAGHPRFTPAGTNIWVNSNETGRRVKYLGTITMNIPNMAFYVSSNCNATNADDCLTDPLLENIVSYRGGMGLYIYNGQNVQVNYATFIQSGLGDSAGNDFKTGMLIGEGRDSDKTSDYLLKNILSVQNSYGCYGTSDLQSGDAVWQYGLLYGNTVADYDPYCAGRVTKSNITTGVNPSLNSIAYVQASSPAATAGEGGGRVGADTRCRYVSAFNGTDIVTNHTTESLWPLPASIAQRTIDETLDIMGTSYDPNALVLDVLAPRDTANIGCPGDVTPPPPPPTFTFRLTNYRINGLYGQAMTPELSLGALGAVNVPASLIADGSLRIRTEIKVETAPSLATGIALYCRKNAGSYAPVTDTFGSNPVRFIGNTPLDSVPNHGTATTQQIGSGSFTPGMVAATSDSPVTLPVMPTDNTTEIDWLVTVLGSLVPTDTVQCEVRKDTGATLGVQTVTPQINIIPPRASSGF